MEAWYTAGKLQATGYYNSYQTEDSKFSSTDKRIEQGMFSSCTTLNLDGEDRVTMMRIIAGREGVSQIDIQTSKFPIRTFGKRKDDLTFQSDFWVPFDLGTDFAGFWGTTDEDGYLAGLGIIQRDSVCTQAFLTAVGRASYDWNTKRPANFDVPSTYPAEYQERVRAMNDMKAVTDASDTSTVPQHSHEAELDVGLIIAVIIVWVFAVSLMSAAIYRKCCKK